MSIRTTIVLASLLIVACRHGSSAADAGVDAASGTNDLANGEQPADSHSDLIGNDLSKAREIDRIGRGGGRTDRLGAKPRRLPGSPKQ